VQLVEQPNGDFAFTIARQFFFDTYNYLLLDELQKGMYVHLAGIAAKGFKEATYHLRHSKEWMLRLGDGTEESHRKAQDAVNNLWRFTGELFLFDEVEQRLAAQGIIPNFENLQSHWQEKVSTVLSSATLALPLEETHPVSGSRKGKHSEHLGHLLAEMQILARSYPDARW
jgi:ring-1,2-phenylacetyl-CoA epoxidase subunit PaaC